MDDFEKMEKGLKESMRRYPNCRIANCDCNHKEWKPGCGCMCHFYDMDRMVEWSNQIGKGSPRKD